jgi:sigma-B regulation protein RsbU (phosphoserine phosphatase)
MCFPAEQIGGDFYDFFSTKDGLNFLIGDVSGKGISAALLMAIVVPAFRTESDRNTLTPLVLNGVNRVVLDNIDRFSGVHVTAFFGSFDTNTKSIDFCNAGHIPPCVFRKSTRSFEWLEGQGYPLGIFDDINGKTGQVPIEKGDILFLFTDGFLEAKNMEGKVFSKDHLLDLILKYSEYDAQSILEKLFEEVLLFLNDSIQKDDATLAVLKF